MNRLPDPDEDLIDSCDERGLFDNALVIGLSMLVFVVIVVSLIS